MKKRVLLKLKYLQMRLEEEVRFRNTSTEVSFEKPDPLLIASSFRDEYIALVCALFSYGNVRSILTFLQCLDFELLNASENEIRAKLDVYYRFQTKCDVQELFITLSRMKRNHVSLEHIFCEGYLIKNDIMQGLSKLIEALYDINSYRSKGYQFLLSKIPKMPYQTPYKRWNMYLRWMVRCDCLDLGLWKSVQVKDLLMPLDVHTYNVGKQLGLITQKTYGYKAVVELTNALKQFDENDPVKYDFALYRIGQEKIIL